MKGFKICHVTFIVIGSHAFYIVLQLPSYAFWFQMLVILGKAAGVFAAPVPLKLEVVETKFCRIALDVG